MATLEHLSKILKIYEDPGTSITCQNYISNHEQSI